MDCYKLNRLFLRRSASWAISLSTMVDLHLLQNAFSTQLHSLGFNFFSLLVVDLMHEFELGVWKGLFVHLLRMLCAINPNLLHELDDR